MHFWYLQLGIQGSGLGLFEVKRKTTEKNDRPHSSGPTNIWMKYDFQGILNTLASWSLPQWHVSLVDKVKRLPERASGQKGENLCNATPL